MPLPAGDSELLRIVDASLADTARRAGEWLLCQPGCTQCCHGAFAISELDALRLQDGMETLRRSEPALADRIEQRARAWVAEHGPEFPGDAATGILGNSPLQLERFEEFANEAACPALDAATGRCDVYAWRPMTCRVFGPPVFLESQRDDEQPLGHCELCFVGATAEQVADCRMEVPLDLEAALLDELPAKDQSLVAFALLRPSAAAPR
jgi:Fe-S-cluster containining protein